MVSLHTLRDGQATHADAKFHHTCAVPENTCGTTRDFGESCTAAFHMEERKDEKKAEKNQDIELRGGRLVATRKRVLLGIEMSVVQASMPTFTATSALAAESKAIPSAFTIFVLPVTGA